MTPMWLVRARLRRDADVAALAPLLMPQDDNARVLAAHRLIWSLMPPDAGATRDFLWREEGHGRFLVLAARPPEGAALFDVQAQVFAPMLAAGDQLRFVLRANPTANVAGPGKRGQRVDVVMRALHGVAPDDRAASRPDVIRGAGAAWIARVGETHGFTPDLAQLVVDGYSRLQIPRAGARPIKVSTLEYAGMLRVDEPVRFLAGLFAGFGRARAFGCGLMLIRRA